MKKAYVELEMENLESLSKVGGFDNDMGSTTESAVASTVSAAIGVSEVVSAATAVSSLSVAWSSLYSCTKNSSKCTRK